jgi:hypothetical protein
MVQPAGRIKLGKLECFEKTLRKFSCVKNFEEKSPLAVERADIGRPRDETRGETRRETSTLENCKPVPSFFLVVISPINS